MNYEYPRRDSLVTYSMINLIDKYTPQIFVLLLGSMFIVLAVLFYVWFYNRRKFHQFKHQIPSSVVKNYLDSIIQNSTALKSSLFRGGGLDVDPNSIPSVMPLDLLQSGGAVGVSAGNGGGGDEALHAEISKLKAELSEKNNTVTELEAKNTELEGVVKQKQERIEELEKLLAEAQANSGGASEDSGALAAITKERDELQDALKQYEIIEDDLADLKRLRQENEQLKQSLNGAEAPAAAAPAPEPVPEAVAPEAAPTPEPEPAPVAEAAPPIQENPTPEPAPVEAAAEQPAAAETTPAEEDKSAEDLLSEFEKMLG